MIVHDQSAEPILDLRSHHAGLRTGALEGNVTVRGTLDRVGLYPGTYWLSPWVTDSTCTYPWTGSSFAASSASIRTPVRYGDLKLEPEWGKYWVESNWTVNLECDRRPPLRFRLNRGRPCIHQPRWPPDTRAFFSTLPRVQAWSEAFPDTYPLALSR